MDTHSPDWLFPGSLDRCEIFDHHLDHGLVGFRRLRAGNGSRGRMGHTVSFGCSLLSHDGAAGRLFCLGFLSNRVGKFVGDAGITIGFRPFAKTSVDDPVMACSIAIDLFQ